MRFEVLTVVVVVVVVVVVLIGDVRLGWSTEWGSGWRGSN
jgi:hypothetical protein